MKDLRHKLFELSIFIKGVDGILDILATFVIAFFAPSLHKVAEFLLRGELIEDPDGKIVNFLFNLSQNLPHKTEIFIAAYMFIHGIIKLGLFIGLRKEKLWAYPVAGIFLTLFVFYQLYIFLHNHSIFLLILMFFDIFIIAMLRPEYKRAVKHLRK